MEEELDKRRYVLIKEEEEEEMFLSRNRMKTAEEKVTAIVDGGWGVLVAYKHNVRRVYSTLRSNHHGTMSNHWSKPIGDEVRKRKLRWFEHTK